MYFQFNVHVGRWNALIYGNGKLHFYGVVKHVSYLCWKILKINRLWMNLGLEKICREFMSYLRYLYSFVFFCILMSTLFQYQMMFVSFNSNTTGVTCGAGIALTLPPPILNEVPVVRSLVSVYCFVDRYFTICPFTFGYCIVWLSSIYNYWLPVRYLRGPITRPKENHHVIISVLIKCLLRMLN